MKTDRFRRIKSGNSGRLAVLAFGVLLSLALLSSCGKKEHGSLGSVFGTKETSEYEDALRQASDGDNSDDYTPSVSHAVIEMVDTVIDLGDVKKGADSQRTARFKFYNRGTGLLAISEVKAFCACTEAEWTQEPVAPDDYGYIEVTFDADLMQGRRFTKNLQVYSNASNGAQVIKVKGTISY